MKSTFYPETAITALVEWVNAHRQTSALLDAQADALLLRLWQASARSAALNAAESSPGALCLYGHGHASKRHLLNTLNIPAPHMRPAGRVGFTSGCALRYSADPDMRPTAFPLRLRLLRECELVQLFISHFLEQGGIVAGINERLRERLTTLGARRQTQASEALTEQDVALVVDYWQRVCGLQGETGSAALWQEFAQLIPHLNLRERASAWALLWDDRRALTESWLDFATTLERLGYHTLVMAPETLLEAPVSAPAQTVLVKPPRLTPVNISLDALTLLCIEVEFSGHCPYGDVLDMPGYPSAHTPTLAQSKIRFLPDVYRQRQQPDLLLMCDVVEDRGDIPAIARQLERWVQQCCARDAGQEPGMIWAITPFDTRFHNGEHVDEGLQQLCSRLSLAWGTLQTLDERGIAQMAEWLSRSQAPAVRAQHYATLRQRLHESLRAAFTPLLREQAQTEAEIEEIVRALQHSAPRHGDLLEALRPSADWFLTPETATAQPRGIFDASLDLFSRQGEEKTGVGAGPGLTLYRCWASYLREKTQDARLAHSLGLRAETLSDVGEILVMTGYRLDLPAEFGRAAVEEGAGGAEIARMAENFMCWLGYARAPLEERPTSIISQGPIFAAPEPERAVGRLTRLPEKPAHAGARYVYDWLVALYVRGCENRDYRHPEDISVSARQHLQRLLTTPVR
ncbi:virulence factor SrfC family protein [Erwinia sp. HR93]|uniref:virulence factor SrfC family protein n=1 Tax=Erwinia sp. HR93 TaxID=3094840 RepID=UPI002ADEBB39|nr:virulence factor SrfC family protein [Erwinia sp. HR93]MEA1062403.1 virulence factor SrfC family protein [Erwinia sp. HR93]